MSRDVANTAVRKAGKARIAVVLSTYNGEKYLEVQLDSVLSQNLPEGCTLDIFVRDDGSTDRTPAILARYRDLGLISCSFGENCGVTDSFMRVLGSVPKGYDYVALCDQDDRWHTDKLARAVTALGRQDPDVPSLYAAEYLICDDELRCGVESKLNKSGVDFYKMLYENVVSGNTAVMNAALVEAVLSAGEDDIYCHDWWVALVASALGTVVFDEGFYCLDYRRTGNNASVTGTGRIEVLKNRVNRFLKNDELDCVRRQLEKLRGSFSTRLDPARCRDLDLLIDGGNAFERACFPHRLRQTPLGELAVRVLLLFGKL